MAEDPERPGSPGSATSPGEELPERMRRRLPDPTRAWAVLVANAAPYAPGQLRHAFVQRQLLKSRGCYLADRLFVALGEDEVAVHQVLPGRVLGRRMAAWPLRTLRLEPVLPVGAPGLWSPAVLLHQHVRRADGSSRRRPVAELRPDGDDPRGHALLDLLARSLDRSRPSTEG